MIELETQIGPKHNGEHIDALSCLRNSSRMTIYHLAEIQNQAIQLRRAKTTGHQEHIRRMTYSSKISLTMKHEMTKEDFVLCRHHC